MAQFLVTGEYIELGAAQPPEQTAAMVEEVIIPSLEKWAELEDEGRLTGGVFAGERAGAFVLEADSHEEVGQILTSLPFWPLIKWQVKPLQSARSTAERERNLLAQLKAPA
jgi:muconolactone delta-isomerase